MMKRKICAILLALCLLAAVVPAAFAQADAFTITSPYDEIDWNTVGQYKTALHTHTNASDGTPTLKESLQRHLETGFDIVAITDHGTVDRGWSSGPANSFIKGALSLFGKSKGDIAYLGESGTFANGVAYSYSANENGDDLLRAADGKTLLRLPFGIEQNAVSVNAHVTSWFADFSDNTVSGYEEGIRGVQKNGGLCVINHPGEYSKARYELHSEAAYDEQNPSFAYHINKFARYLEKYPACIGIDMNSKGDSRTRFDRILWDKLLQRFAAKGETVLGIASSDAHQLSVIDTGFSVLLLQELSCAAAKDALQSGAFFAASHCLGNPDELYEIAAALQSICGEENKTLHAVRAAADQMTQRVADIESGRLGADEDIGITYSVLDGSGFSTADSFPRIERITVDDAENTICIESEDALLVRFISGGKTVATLPADSAVLDLDDYAAELGDYVRAEVFGEGGMLYTQAFLLNAEQNAAANGDTKVTRGCFLDLGTLDFIIAEAHKWLRISALFFKTTFKF